MKEWTEKWKSGQDVEEWTRSERVGISERVDTKWKSGHDVEV